MKRLGESQLQRIMRKTGRKPIQCKCKLCQQQCHTPCLGTPQDILRIIKAGYADRVSWADWGVGMLMGCTDHIIGMVQANQDGDWCTFFHDGLCELHDKGLKPTEGRLSHHSMRLDNWSPKKSISWNVAKEWEDEENAPVLEEIYELLKRTGIITKTATASDDTDGLESGGNGGDNNGSQQGGGTDNGGSEEGDQN